MSPAASERALQLLTVAAWQVLSRCQETLSNTPRILGCWVRSWTHSYFPYLFESPIASTIRRYGRIGISGVCYFVRMRLLAKALHEDITHMSGLKLSGPQISAIDDVWTKLTDVVAKETTEASPSKIPDECLEALFQFFVTLWTESPADGEVEHTAVARFSGVLGIHPTELNFRTAYTYTPLLSAMIWIGRLVLLEYALPLRSYDHLRVPWPSRDRYTDLASRLCAQIRPKYLQMGSLAPMGYLIERIQHGRAIAKREGPQTNISWSKDKQELTIEQSTISMPQFRRIVHEVITETQHRLEDLLLSWWPSLRLSDIQDDINDYDGFLCLLSYQTGHRPLTHGSAYALENAFPTKLQPDLLERYLQNSRVWHDFLLISEEDVVELSSDYRFGGLKQKTSLCGYFPDPPEQDVEVIECVHEGSWSDTGAELQIDPLSADDQQHNGSRNLQQRKTSKKRKRTALSNVEINVSPTSQRIKELQDELHALAKQRKLRTRTGQT